MPNQPAQCVIGVNCCGTAGMPGIPGFQHGVRFRPAHLSHNNARRLQTHARTKAIQHRNAAHGAQVDVVRNGALKLGGVFNRDDSILRSNARKLV